MSMKFFVIVLIIFIGGVSFFMVQTFKTGRQSNQQIHQKQMYPPQVATSENFRNELTYTNFIPAQPNHYYCDLGQVYLKYHNYQAAIDSFNKALESEKAESRQGRDGVPTDVGKLLHQAEISYFLGSAYQNNRNINQARDAYQNTIQLYESIMDKLSDPEKELIQLKLANLYITIGKNDSAEQICRKLLAEGKSDEVRKQAKSILSNLLLKQGRLDEINIEKK